MMVFGGIVGMCVAIAVCLAWLDPNNIYGGAALGIGLTFVGMTLGSLLKRS
jgi:hypothetical protein